MSETLMVYNCPFCVERKGTPDTKGHFYWYGYQNGYFCFRCGAVRGKGPLPPELEGVDILDQHLDFRFPGETITDKPPYYLRHASDAWRYLTARSYLDKRGISEKVAKASNILYATRGDYAQRVIFPVFDYRILGAPKSRSWRDSTVYFVARTTIGAEPKYLNCPTGKNGWVYLVAGRDNNKIPFNLLLVVEGVFDAFSAARSGIPAAAIFGKRINASQCRQIAALTNRAMVLLDNDAFASSLGASHRLSYYVPTLRAELPPKMDPDKLVMNHGPHALKGIIDRTLKAAEEEHEDAEVD